MTSRTQHMRVSDSFRVTTNCLFSITSTDHHLLSLIAAQGGGGERGRGGIVETIHGRITSQ